MHACCIEHFLGQGHRQFDDVGRPPACQDLQAFPHLQGVASSQAQWSGHIGEQRTRLHARVGSQSHHGFGQFAGLLGFLHECPRADLDIQHERASPLGDLLAHNGGGNQRHAGNGGGGVPQGVELLVCGCESAARGADHRTGAARSQHREDFLVAEIRAPAGNRFQLVEGAAGVSQTAAGELRHAHAKDRHQGGQWEGDLVSYSPGGVFVRGGLSQLRKVHPFAGTNHGVGPASDLFPVHSVEVDRHGQGTHLFLAHRSARVGVDHPVNLCVVQHLPVTLGCNDVDDVERFYPAKIVSAHGYPL